MALDAVGESRDACGFIQSNPCEDSQAAAGHALPPQANGFE